MQWLTSYLENRQQFVDLNSVKSKLQYVSYDFAQGSLLGPLFSIYGNDFATDNASTGELHLYAYNTTAYFVIGGTIDQVSQLLNVFLADICSWCELNRLTIHPKKCEAMIISRKQFIGRLQQVRCANLVIDLSNVVKSLGLLIDNKLSWNIILINYPKVLSSASYVEEDKISSDKAVGKHLVQNDFAEHHLLPVSLGQLLSNAEIEKLHIKLSRTDCP